MTALALYPPANSAACPRCGVTLSDDPFGDPAIRVCSACDQAERDDDPKALADALHRRADALVREAKVTHAWGAILATLRRANAYRIAAQLLDEEARGR